MTEEHRKIRYNKADIYCRYLNINLPLSSGNSKSSGRFGDFLKEIGIKKFPYNINMAGLVFQKIIKPALYVELAVAYFKDWKNFPKCPRQSDSRPRFIESGCYNLKILPQNIEHLDDLVHPYDGSWKDSFTKKYQAEFANIPETHHHRNGSKYIAAEAYLSYWQAYALADSFYLYRHVDRLLSKQDGMERVLELIKNKVDQFSEKYAATFDRVSWYKTIATAWWFSKIDCTSGELLELTQKYTHLTVDELKQDLHRLLALDAAWLAQINNHGCIVLQDTRNSLAQDIYWIYELLRLMECSADSLFVEFQPQGRMGGETPLYMVLDNEDYIFQNSFIGYGDSYCTEIKQWDYTCTNSIFDDLFQIAGFAAWIRAFHDLHRSLNNKNFQKVTFKQDRIVDALIVMSVRTEIVLREMFRPSLESQSDEQIVKFLKKIKGCLPDEESKKILETGCNEVGRLTKLNQRPEDIFSKIEEFKPNNWSEKKIYFLHAILKFITARNYFAHHAYKDDELNIQTSELAAEILKSLFATLLFFNKQRQA